MLLGIKKVKTTAYHPQCDGLVERLNQTILSMLSKYVGDNQRDWDIWIGRQPRLLVDADAVPYADAFPDKDEPGGVPGDQSRLPRVVRVRQPPGWLRDCGLSGFGKNFDSRLF